MGCFTVTCSVSRLPIDTDDPVVAVVLSREGESRRSFDNGVELVPCTLPLRGHYNNYGGIYTIERSDRAAAVLETFQRRAHFEPRFPGVEAPPKSLEQWLTAVAGHQVSIKSRSFEQTLRPATLTLIRQDVWDYLYDRRSPRFKELNAADHRCFLEIHTEVTLYDDRFTGITEELHAVHLSLNDLGRTWTRNVTHKQEVDWNVHVDFAMECLVIANRERKRRPR